MEFKKTGIVRRIDDLGRIVIPKELRRELGVEIGDPFELSLLELEGKKAICATPYCSMAEGIRKSAFPGLKLFAQRITERYGACLLCLNIKFDGIVCAGAKEELLSSRELTDIFDLQITGRMENKKSKAFAEISLKFPEGVKGQFAGYAIYDFDGLFTGTIGCIATRRFSKEEQDELRLGLALLMSGYPAVMQPDMNE